MNDAKALIARHDLAPHPEGGWYRETWRAQAGDGERSPGTAILFLL
ncbi:MAG: cupin domain-containing protein, partial [Sphingomonas sp.]|nr:cupin domain-containing protein [Sphingomonas sp.]